MLNRLYPLRRQFIRFIKNIILNPKFYYFNDEKSFNLLIKKSIFKLITKCKAKITKLPQIKTQLELLEFVRLVKFMAKFHFKLETKFDSIYFTKFDTCNIKFEYIKNITPYYCFLTCLKP